MSVHSPNDRITTGSPVNATAASLLGLLLRRPMSGWELYAAFESSIGEFWSLTRSQVYREIQTLAAGGFIEMGASGVRERRVCTITALGRETFSAWIAGMPGDELIRFPLLLTTFFGDSVPPDVLRAACVEHRRKHVARLAVYEAQLPDVLVNDPFPALSLQFGIAYERTVIAWIDGLPWMKSEEPSLLPALPSVKPTTGRQKT